MARDGDLIPHVGSKITHIGQLQVPHARQETIFDLLLADKLVAMFLEEIDPRPRGCATDDRDVMVWWYRTAVVVVVIGGRGRNTNRSRGQVAFFTGDFGDHRRGCFGGRLHDATHRSVNPETQEEEERRGRAREGREKGIRRNATLPNGVTGAGGALLARLIGLNFL